MTLPLFVSPDLVDMLEFCHKLMADDPDDYPALRDAWFGATYDDRPTAADRTWLAELDWRARCSRRHAGRVEHAGPSDGAHRVSAEDRRFIQRTHPWCHYCGGLGAEIDHIWPRARGGCSDLRNLAHACRRCNDEKRDKTVGQWREARLARGEQWPPPPHWPSDLEERVEAVEAGKRRRATARTTS